MASGFYNYGKGEILKGNVDLENDTIKIAKMATTHTVDIDAHHFLSDVSADRVGTDQTLANGAVTVDDTNDRAEFDADNVVETGVTLTTDKVIFYKDTGTASTSVLLAYADITEGTVSPVSGDLTFTFNSEGILAI